MIGARVLKSVLSRPGLLKVLAGGRRWGPIPLIYHDLREDADPSSWLRVTVSDFTAHIRVLQTYGRFVDPLDDDANAAEQPGLRFVMTFDDGYRNNHVLAKPVLEAHGIPALFFVSTGHLESGRPFWFDELVTPIQALGLRELDLGDFGLGRFRFREDDEAGRWDDINTFLVALKNRGNMDAEASFALLEHFRKTYIPRVHSQLEAYRPLNEHEVRDLASSPLFHVGSHAHQHDILTYLDDAQLRENMIRPRDILAGITGRPTTTIAYPNGDFDQRVVQAAVDAGYRRGYTARPGTVRIDGDRMRIPRLLVGGYDTPEMLRYKIARILLQELGKG